MRLSRVWLPIVGFLVGFAVVLRLPTGVPYDYGSYLSLATLAGLDSIFGGIRAGLEGKFRNDVFLSGFVVDMVLAVLLALLGDQIGCHGSLPGGGRDAGRADLPQPLPDPQAVAGEKGGSWPKVRSSLG